MLFASSLPFLCLAAAASPSSFAVTCAGYGKEQNNTDLVGTVISTQGGKQEECCAQCDALPTCDGWVWFADVCYHKTGVSGTYNNTGRVALLKQKTGDCSTFDAPQNDHDLAGDMLSTSYAAKIDGCCGACSAAAECGGFAYKDQTCYLKKNVQGPYTNAGTTGTIAQTKAMPKNCTSFTDVMQNTDLAGQMIHATFGDSADACCNLCTSSSACKGFSYDGNTCYLKGPISGTFASNTTVARCVGSCKSVSGSIIAV